MRNWLRITGARCRRAGYWLLTAAILYFGTVGITPLRADEVMRIAPHVWKGFEEYKRRTVPKVFAVSADGLVYGYSYCPEYRCRLMPDARSIALNSCAQGGGKACRVFAVGTDIKVEYKVVPLIPQLAPAPAPTPATPPAPECRNKTETECTAILADFGTRRRAIEGKWAAKIQELRRIHCPGYTNVRLCKNIVTAAEADRDAELKALERELQQALAN